METTRVYAACLASYNAGKLHGAWIDADQDEEEIQDEIAAMLRASPEPNVFVDCPECDGDGCEECDGKGKVPSAEEWAFHDYDGMPDGLGEFESVEDISLHGRMTTEHGDAWRAYAQNATTPSEDDFADTFYGEWDSEVAYAEHYVDSCGLFDNVSDHFSMYFDYEKYARDLFIDLTSVRLNGAVYVFSS